MADENTNPEQAAPEAAAAPIAAEHPQGGEAREGRGPRGGRGRGGNDRGGGDRGRGPRRDDRGRGRGGDAAGNGDRYLTDAAHQNTSASTSPPTFWARASASESTPRGVETMVMPRPLRTTGSSLEPE